MGKWLIAFCMCLLLAGCSSAPGLSGLPQLEQAGENTPVSKARRWKPAGQVDLPKLMDKEKLTLLFFLADW